MTNRIVRRFYRTRRCRSRAKDKNSYPCNPASGIFDKTCRRAQIESLQGISEFNLPKILIFAGLFFVAGFLLTTFNPWLAGYTRLYAQEAEIYIENRDFYPSKSRPAVYFSHEIHMETYECLFCHHDYQEGENILSENDLDEDGSAACVQCHADNTPIELMAAYHRQCMNCHRSVNSQETASLPITCADCHNRRSQGK
jgi:hypothetical protein